MSNVAITVEDLSKCYRIGLKGNRHDTIIGAGLSWIKSPISNYRKVLKLTRFGGNENEEDVIWALRNVSFEVKHGEVIGIVGRNGAGKSTLLKVIARITKPTSGKAILNGRVSSLLEVGTGFHPELTGRENIYLNGTILGMSKAEIDRKFDEIVSFSEVEKFLDTPVKRYSSGMKVRLAFAVAAHLEPEILLIDEVLAVGDVAFQNKCMGKMDAVSREGRTVLFVSHNMAAIRSLCPYGLFMKEGQIVFDGPIDEAIDRYLETGAKRTGSILSHSKSNDPGVQLQTITVNGVGNDTLWLPPNSSRIEVAATGWIDRPRRIMIEAKIFDLREQCLGFFTPRFFRSALEILPPGPFHFSESIALPPMNRGEYFLALYIAESAGNISYPIIIFNAVRLSVEGTPTTSGFVFGFAQNNGWILLQNATENPQTNR